MDSADTPTGTTAPAEVDASTLPARLQTWLDAFLASTAWPEVDPKRVLAEHFKRQYRFLGLRRGERYEVQLLAPDLPDPNKKRDLQQQRFAYTDSLQGGVVLLYKAARDYSYQGLYVIPQIVNPAALSKAAPDTWHVLPSGGGTSAKDISVFLTSYADFDAIRDGGAKKISATRDELMASCQRGIQFMTDAAEILGSERALALLFSGNGCQGYVALDRLPHTDEVQQLRTEFVRSATVLYSDARVAGDDSVCNPNRLAPAAGTLKRKGHHDIKLGRVHRLTGMWCADEVERLSLDEFRTLVEGLKRRLTNEQRQQLTGRAQRFPATTIKQAIPTALTATGSKTTGPSPFDLANALPIRDVYVRLGQDPSHPKCPGCGADDTTAFLDDKLGVQSMKCQHATCGARSWKNIDLVVVLFLGRALDDKAARSEAVAWLADAFPDAGIPKMRKTKRARRHDGGPPENHASPSDDRPEIIISTKQESVNDAAVDALGKAHPDIYQRGLRLVRVLLGDGAPIVQVAEATLRERLASAARWVHATQNGLMPAHPPGWAVKAVFERRQWAGVRHLRGVVGTPVLRSDGSVLSTQGYDEATGLLYIPSCDVGDLLERPTREEALRARDELLEVVGDFPFEGEQHKASWLAGLLTPFAIHAIAGPTPMIVVDGNVRGAGKGLLVDAAATITSGKPFAKMAHVKSDEELEKRITSLGLAGAPACVVDNLRGFFGGPVWEAMLTTRHWRGRILGKSETVDLLLDIVWWVTGNNVEIGGDMGRRVLHVRLLSPEERPEERTAFKHPDLIAWVRNERPRLVRAALTILRAYVVAGRPEQEGVRLGSFEDWARFVASAVVWVGLPDPCKTRDGLEERAESDEARLGGLIDAWTASFGNEGRTAAEVLRLIESEDRRTSKPSYSGDSDDFEPHRFIALRDILVEGMGRDGRLPTARQLGSRLGHFRERNVGSRCFVAEIGSHDKIARWRVTDVRVLRDVAGSLVSQKNPQETIRDSGALEGLRVLAGTDSESQGRISEDHDHVDAHVDYTTPVIEPGAKRTPQYPHYPQCDPEPRRVTLGTSDTTDDPDFEAMTEHELERWIAARERASTWTN